MGSCIPVSAKSKQPHTQHIRFSELAKYFNEELLSTPDLQNKLLRFRISISRLCAKSLPRKNTFVEVIFDGSAKEYFTTDAVEDVNPTWSFSAQFEYSSLFSRLTQDSVQFHLKYITAKDVVKTLSILKIDCFTLAIGPIEHDIALHSTADPSKIVGRLCFSLQFQQIQEIEVDMDKIRLELDGKVDQKFYLSLQAQTPEGTIDSIAKGENITPIYEPTTGRSLVQLYGHSLPVLKFYTTYTYLSSSCIRISLWTTPDAKTISKRRKFSTDTDPNVDHREDEACAPVGDLKFQEIDIDPFEHEEEDPLFGECYISFLKLLGNEMTVLEPNTNARKNSDTVKSTYSTKIQKEFSESLGNCGKLVGKVWGRFIVSDPPFLKQMFCGVHTEYGFSFVSSSVLLNESVFSFGSCGCTGNDKIPKEIQRLIIMKNMLLKYTKELRTKDYPREAIINSLKELRNILMVSHTFPSRKSFFYNSTKDLLQSQLHLLELGLHCVQIADYADYQLRCYYYNILTLLFLRGEFSLENLRFRGNASGVLLQTKQKIGLQFQSLLYKALLLSLCKLSIRGLTSDQQEFVETFLATAFFRIPEFRGKVLESLYRESDEYIEEWRQFSLDEPECKGTGMYNLFNWTEEFYAFLPPCKEKTESAEFLEKVLRLTEWKRQFHCRGVAFFKFVAHWVRYVSNLIVNEGVPWQDIPGYTGIVKALLNEMLHRDVLNYPEALKDAINALLVNENMLTVFVKIVFQKTAIYDYRTVNQTLELVNLWFQTVCVKNVKVVPSNFDFPFFFKAIDILMTIENPMGCEKCLWLIYKIAHLLPRKRDYIDQKDIGAVLLQAILSLVKWSSLINAQYNAVSLPQLTTPNSPMSSLKVGLESPKAGLISDNPNATASSVKLNVTAIKVKYDAHMIDFEKLENAISELTKVQTKGKPNKFWRKKRVGGGYVKLSEDLERLVCLVPDSMHVYIQM